MTYVHLHVGMRVHAMCAEHAYLIVICLLQVRQLVQEVYGPPDDEFPAWVRQYTVARAGQGG